MENPCRLEIARSKKGLTIKVFSNYSGTKTDRWVWYSWDRLLIEGLNARNRPIANYGQDNAIIHHLAHYAAPDKILRKGITVR